MGVDEAAVSLDDATRFVMAVSNQLAVLSNSNFTCRTVWTTLVTAACRLWYTGIPLRWFTTKKPPVCFPRLREPSVARLRYITLTSGPYCYRRPIPRDSQTPSPRYLISHLLFRTPTRSSLHQTLAIRACPSMATSTLRLSPSISSRSCYQRPGVL